MATRVRGVLGRVHRDIGAPQQVDDAGTGVALGHAGARAHGQARAVEDEGLGDPIEDRRGDPAAVVSRRKRAEDGELVTPEPHEQVVLGRARGEAPRDLAEQLVACGMAEGVVDLLEVVQVDQDQREPVCGVRGLEALRAVLEERAPVPEPGEVVRDRLATSVGEALHLPEARPVSARRRAGA